MSVTIRRKVSEMTLKEFRDKLNAIDLPDDTELYIEASDVSFRTPVKVYDMAAGEKSVLDPDASKPREPRYKQVPCVWISVDGLSTVVYNKIDEHEMMERCGD